MTNKLIEYICPKCKRSLAWAYVSANVYCKCCDKWVCAGELIRTNPAMIAPDNDQLILFD